MIHLVTKETDTDEYDPSELCVTQVNIETGTFLVSAGLTMLYLSVDARARIEATPTPDPKPDGCELPKQV